MDSTLVKKDLYVNGKWVEAKSYKDLYAPYSQEVLAEVPEASEEEVDQAVQSAKRASTKLRKMPAHERAYILENIAKLMEDRSEEAAQIIAKEAAKPIQTARGEVARTIQTYKFAAEEAKRIGGETISLDAAPGGENRMAYTVREPIGVVAAITPFNFPMNLVAHKVGPAIAAGNPVVLKPAEQTPLSSFFLAELAEEAGLPAGGLNVVTGEGSIVGEALVTDGRINAVTFTGSPEVGTGIRNKAGLKKVTLELGSNSGVIVDEGVDLDKVVPRAVQGAFAYQGQVCISLQRIYVHEQIYDAFVEKFLEETKKLVIGDPLSEDTNVSSMISKKDVERSIDWLREAVEDGAEIAYGGVAEGTTLHPTVVKNAGLHTKVSCQEVFAPIVSINKVSSVEEGIKCLNHSKYGLQAGVYTNDIHKGLDAVDALEVGGVLINDIPTFRVDHMPYGGVKQSGTGREGLKYAVEEMTEMKLVILNRN
ncbi:aldehyde dehydrogenase family protein [Pontibacillus marinus]|uniref:Aldehyde dehydrogenase n=1 Tax=Pontibacillus marinus BH030004 = DSM 16465 TaxID=1385511 RepID=A0A0A5GKM4_9BACI|nr:aldehyde dehydrogenase family protein [Pontibacillus marinus]KGX91783.1 aldehyde dehydrogenase [Pontibacillus marinus BH030004 = DSM 16465]